tara:strand:+ start:481 stop:993 length:513 start_codon:yes stop_codon:yes gene_type:complete
MPNNCNSISKFFSLVIVISLYSCTNFEQLSSQKQVFNAKFQLLKEQYVYKSNIIAFKDRIIIQFNQPFLGNVGKFELFRNGYFQSDLLLDIKDNKNFQEISNNFSETYFDLIYSCLQLNSIEYEDSFIKLKCNKYGDINIRFKNYNNVINIKLMVSRKIERGNRTPTEIK